jgi:hypothetical protein
MNDLTITQQRLLRAAGAAGANGLNHNRAGYAASLTAEAFPARTAKALERAGLVEISPGSLRITRAGKALLKGEAAPAAAQEVRDHVS